MAFIFSFLVDVYFLASVPFIKLSIEKMCAMTEYHTGPPLMAKAFQSVGMWVQGFDETLIYIVYIPGNCSKARASSCHKAVYRNTS